MANFDTDDAFWKPLAALPSSFIPATSLLASVHTASLSVVFSKRQLFPVPYSSRFRMVSPPLSDIYAYGAPNQTAYHIKDKHGVALPPTHARYIVHDESGAPAAFYNGPYWHEGDKHPYHIRDGSKMLNCLYEVFWNEDMTITRSHRFLQPLSDRDSLGSSYHHVLRVAGSGSNQFTGTIKIKFIEGTYKPLETSSSPQLSLHEDTFNWKNDLITSIQILPRTAANSSLCCCDATGQPLTGRVEITFAAGLQSYRIVTTV